MVDERSEPHRLTLVIPSLQYGGAERVMATLADEWSDSGRDVTLITLSARATDTYRLDERVQRIALDAIGTSPGPITAIFSNLRRLLRLRNALRQSRPDVIVSFIDRMNVMTLLATIGWRRNVIISERTDPSRHRIGRIWSGLRRRVYRRCRGLVVQSEPVRTQMQPLVGSRPVYVIPNPVTAPPGEAEQKQPSTANRRAGEQTPQKRTVVGMGRLSAEKGFDRLIEAFSRIAKEQTDWRLLILGEGPCRAELAELIERKQLSDLVTLVGWVEHPETVLRRSDLFVLPSRYEGFPNALLEALACGVPAVVFDVCPAEIVRNNIDGLRVPAGDIAALSAAMSRLMSNEAERARLANNALDAIERFSQERFLAAWNTVLRGDDPAGETNSSRG